MIFHEQFFEAGGTLEYEQLLYCEEVYVGATTERLGLRVSYEPSVVVFHREHGVIHLWPRPSIIRHLADSHLHACKVYLRPREDAAREGLSARTLSTPRTSIRSVAEGMVSAEAAARNDVFGGEEVRK